MWLLPIVPLQIYLPSVKQFCSSWHKILTCAESYSRPCWTTQLFLDSEIKFLDCQDTGRLPQNKVFISCLRRLFFGLRFVFQPTVLINRLKLMADKNHNPFSSPCTWYGNLTAQLTVGTVCFQPLHFTWETQGCSVPARPTELAVNLANSPFSASSWGL